MASKFCYELAIKSPINNFRFANYAIAKIFLENLFLMKKPDHTRTISSVKQITPLVRLVLVCASCTNLLNA